jgi:hypothetical protein
MALYSAVGYRGTVSKFEGFMTSLLLGGLLIVLQGN